MNEEREKKEIIENFVLKAQKGDTEAFGYIYDIFVDKIYRYVFYRVPDADSEDVVSNIFLKVWENIKKYKKQKGASFNSWIFRIARNAVADFHRKSKTTETLSEDISDNTEEDTIKKVSKKIDFENSLKALFDVKEKHREILIMKYIDELKYPEIANILGKTESAVRVSHMRGLNEIREILNCNEK